MTLSRRIRSADPLGGVLPGALPAPDRACAEVINIEWAGPPRRNARRWLATGGAVALACAVLAVVLAQRGGDGASRPERPSDVAAIALLSPKLAAHFAIFRRAPRPDDALPAEVLRTLRSEGVSVRYSRLLAADGRHRVYVVPGRRLFCIALLAPDAAVAGTCRETRFASFFRAHSALGGTYGTGDEAVVFALLADGATDALLENRGAPVSAAAIAGNGVLAPVDGADRLSWQAPDGSRHGLVIREPGQFTPSALHDTRPPGTVFGDEIGENIVGLATPYVRVVELFGPPAHVAVRDSDGLKCVYYHMVGSTRGWQFCFTDERMTSGSGYFPEAKFPHFPED